MSGPSGQQFLKAVERFERTERSETQLRMRGVVRRILGLEEGGRILVAGAQPLFLGGTPKVLAKLLLLKALQKLDPRVETVYVLAHDDAPRSDREVYRTLVPFPSGDRWLGLPRGGIRYEVRGRRLLVEPPRLAAVLAELRSAFDPLELPELVERHLDRPVPSSLSGINSGFLRELAEELGLSPDHWVDLTALETQLALGGFWPVLMEQWRALVVACNHRAGDALRRLEAEEAPVWLYGDGDERIPVRCRGGILAAGRASCHWERWPEMVVERGWSLGFRAIPRVLGLSWLMDGQVTGSGSRYQDVLEKAAAACGLPVVPRLIAPRCELEYPALVLHPPWASAGRRELNYGLADLLTVCGIPSVRAQVAGLA